VSVTIGKDRVGALTDGIAAIAATLLVLDLQVPAANGDLQWNDILASAHLLLGWAISLVMIGVIWFEQHVLFSRTAHWDVSLMVVTGLQLAALSLIPFASGLISDYPASLVAMLVFSAVMLANGLLIAINGGMLGRRPHLHQSEGAARYLSARSKVQIVSYLAIATFAVAAAMLHHPLTGVLAWALSPLAVASYRLFDHTNEINAQHHRFAEPAE
jgi:uncharacterized membrane protein